MNNHFRYKNLFIFSSLQFIGNIEEYFVHHTEKLVVHIIMPRTNNKYNIVRLYSKGKLVNEKEMWSTQNIFLYYGSWYLQHLYIIFHYFRREEKFYVMSFMPLNFFFGSLQKIFRPQMQFVFFIADFCPAKTISIILFERVKKYYHDHLLYACYLSDILNKIMNGKVVKTKNRKTVMWGVKPKAIRRSANGEKFELLFVGLIKDSQGLEFFYEFLHHNKNCHINILGVCDEVLYAKHQKIIAKYNIREQVYFPNKFFSDTEVVEVSKKCHAGIALYDIGKKHMTYYTEPGKVKFYAELGLPIIMSNVSATAVYVEKFHAGEIVKRDMQSIITAIKKIKKNYASYIAGLKIFNKYFYYENYYRDKFSFLE